MRVKSILVICSGNICRSPFGEGYLRHRLAQMSLQDVLVRSAGTLGIVGSPASADSIALAADEGFDLSSHRSSAVTADGLDEAEIVLVMERAHQEALRERFPNESHRVRLLSEYHASVQDPDQAPDIFDPIGRSSEDYRRCFQLIKGCLEAFLADDSEVHGP